MAEYEGWPYPAFVEDIDLDEGHRLALRKNVVNISSSSSSSVFFFFFPCFCCCCFSRMYLWWNVCTLYLLACQVSVTVGNFGLCV